MPRNKNAIVSGYATEIESAGIKMFIVCGTTQKLERAVRMLTGMPGYDARLVDHVHIVRSKDQPHRDL
jgi:hypothetical protein